MKRFAIRRLVTMMCASGMLVISTQALASAFQLWEQDGSSVGSYHAGYAALANDASTAWYNPAGITRFKNQQIVVGGAAIMTDFKYRGTVAVNTLGNVPQGLTAQGGTFGFVPNVHYVAPITDRVGFGFSVDVPFGLKTDYGRSTALRYAATLTSVTVIDISPSLALQITPKGSLGAGLDIQKMSAEFDNVATVFTPLLDTNSVNEADDTGYGFHAGGLYQFTPDSRIGLSYHSQVVHHLKGTSKFYGPLANNLNGGPIETNNGRVNITLPPYTALSMYQRVHPQVALMGTIIYTQWSTFKNLILNNLAGVQNGVTTTTLQVTIPENYRNTWNFSVGAEYYATERVTLRGGVGYDQTPVNDTDRNVQLPDNNRFVIALGGHFQATRAVGVDLGWTHLFVNKTHVAPRPQVTGTQIVTTHGSATGGADVIGAQVTWDLV